MSEGARTREEEPLAKEPGKDRELGRAVALVLAGIGIGAGLALLLTPRRGDEIRDAIGRGYRKTLEGLTERAQSLTEDLRERAQNLREDLSERAPKLLRFALRRGGMRRYREG